MKFYSVSRMKKVMTLLLIQAKCLKIYYKLDVNNSQRNLQLFAMKLFKQNNKMKMRHATKLRV